MLELVATRASVVGCFASPVALDALERAEGAYACRVASDEIMLVGDAASADELVRAATEPVIAADPDALVIDTTDGWAVWTLAGESARDAFARLSAVVLPGDGYTQGDVAHVPARVIALPDHVHILIPAMWGGHLRERILADCASLDVHERTEPGEWTSRAALSEERPA